jgi:hypothetical protein
MADRRAGLDHDGLQPAFQEMRRGGEAHGTGADHGDFLLRRGD